jgi:hypothetical protein
MTVAEWLERERAAGRLPETPPAEVLATAAEMVRTTLRDARASAEGASGDRRRRRR